MLRESNLPAWLAIVEAAPTHAHLAPHDEPRLHIRGDKVTLIGTQGHVVTLRPDSPSNTAHLHREQDLLGALGNSPLANYVVTPEPLGIFHVEGPDKRYVGTIRRCLEGESLESWTAARHQPVIGHDHIREIGVLVGLFHRHGPAHILEANPLRDIKPTAWPNDAATQLADTLNWQGPARQQWLKFAATENCLNFEGPTIFAHADLHWGNIICHRQGELRNRDGRFAVIDFEAARKTTPLQDIASAHPITSLAGLRAFQEGYAEVMGAAPAQSQILGAQVAMNARKAATLAPTNAQKVGSPHLVSQLGLWSQLQKTQRPRHKPALT